MNVYRSLSVLCDGLAPLRQRSYLSDVRDLGLQDTYRAYEAYRASECPIYFQWGPEFTSANTGKKEQATWLL